MNLTKYANKSNVIFLYGIIPSLLFTVTTLLLDRSLGNSGLHRNKKFVICIEPQHFEIPKEVSKRLSFYRSRFFWQSDGQQKKYRLTIKNGCLISKWLFKLLSEKAFGNNYFLTGTLGVKLFRKFRLNLLILPFEKELLGLKLTSSIGVLLSYETA
jgi:hypothetical protein